MTNKKKQEILDTVRQLAEFKLEWMIDEERFPEIFNNYGYAKGDENAPFFSEAILYNLVGKEDARTILSLVRNVLLASGLKDEDFMEII